MIEFKRLKSLIGQGVAIECPDGLVKKFKVLAIKTTFDKDGERIDAVKLDVPAWLHYSFWTSPITKRELKDGIWVYPVFLYKNKGECARQRFEEKLKRAAEAEARWKETVISLEKELSVYKKTLQEATAELEELEAAYKKCKFASKGRRKKEKEDAADI